MSQIVRQHYGTVRNADRYAEAAGNYRHTERNQWGLGIKLEVNRNPSNKKELITELNL